jgi:hypothetical protein
MSRPGRARPLMTTFNDLIKTARHLMLARNATLSAQGVYSGAMNPTGFLHV